MLEIYLFGGMELNSQGESLSLPATIRSRSLLAYLVTHRPSSHYRERLAGLFWPDRSRSKALRSLSTALWHIRRVLPADEYIIADAQRVQFNPRSDYWLDVEEFKAVCSRASGSPNPKPEALESECERLQHAVALYRGDFLEGFYDDWCLEERYRLEALYLEALERLAVCHEALDQPEEALRAIRLLLARDPLREDIHRAAIQLHTLLGNRAEALRQARWCRAVLQTELGVEPAPATAALCDELLGPAWRHGPGSSPKKSAAPPNLAAGFLSRPPFVGREPEMQRLTLCWERTRTGQGCLVLVSGEAGIGKSRLVEEFSSWVRQRGGWAVGAAQRSTSNPANGALSPTRPGYSLSSSVGCIWKRTTR